MKDIFRRLANWSADKLGSPVAFMMGIIMVMLWAATGPIFHFSDAWQLVVNTATNILTFVMVFLIQNTQNRDTKAMQLKLDELLRAVGEARTQLVDLEDAPEDVIARLKEEFQVIKAEHPPLAETLEAQQHAPAHADAIPSATRGEDKKS